MILRGLDVPESISLYRGQMGITIAIALYARHHSVEQIELCADKYMLNIRRWIKSIHNISFAFGLSGICWGVEYLVQHGFIPGAAHDMLKKIDEIIAKHDVTTINNFSLESGLLGLWHYIMARIQGNLKAGLELPFSHDYIDKWLHVIGSNPDNFPYNALERLQLALSGNLIEEELKIEQFINVEENFDEHDLSLQNGISGYLILKCL